MQPPALRSATETERHQVLQTVVLGFAADPLNRWFLGGAANYLDTAYSLIDALGGSAIDAGSAYVVSADTNNTDAGQDLAGAALWLPPNIKPDAEPVLKLLQAAMVPERLNEVFELVEKIGEHQPKEAHWYLPYIAVDPVHQGQGLGSKLMKHALRMCDETQTLAYLESSNPKNMSLYERHGFETLARIQVESSPPVHPMVRQPRRL